jgi:3-hydroxy-2-methylpyridine-4,5-dicarboxylate 4-decarboxylase
MDVMIVDSTNIVVKTADQAIKQLVMANRIVANEGLLDGFGHVSIRNPDNPGTFFITRALSAIEVTKQDIAEVALDGKVVSKPLRRVGGETFIHSEIFKARPEINAVFHGHNPAVIPFTVMDIPMRPLLNTAGFIYQGVRVFDDYSAGSGYLINSKVDGERVAIHLGQDRVQLLRSHGINIVAESLPRVIACAYFVNINANLQWQAMTLGREPRYLNPAEAREGAEVALLKDNTMSRWWGYWMKRLKYAMPNAT